MNKFYGIIMAIIIGICLGVQPTVNSTLGKAITSKTAAFHSLLTSFSLIFIITMFSGNLHTYKNITKVSPIYWIGGVLGVTIVFFSIKVVPILGPTLSFSIFVAVQLITGAIINHFGLFGVTPSPMNIIKIIGILLLIIGVKLVQ